MSTKTVCDRCGKVIDGPSPGKLTVTYNEAGHSNMDICLPCEKPVRNLIGRLLLTKPKGKAPAKRPKPAVEPMPDPEAGAVPDLPDPHPHFRD